MLSAFAQAFRTPDLRRKLLFTLFIMAVFRLGSFIPTPGVNSTAIQACIAQQNEASLLDLVNIFSGGALLQLSVFALGIMPYITASIIIQLLRVVIPRFDDLHKEGQSGQAKLTQYTRYLTIFLGVLQSTTTISLARSGQLFAGCNQEVIKDRSVLTFLMMIVVMMAGTGVIMWLGELVTERGIGNGMSLLIFTSIAARLPSQMLGIGRAGKWGSVLVILVLLYFGLPSAGMSLSGFWATWLALTLVLAAFAEEIYWAGITAVPRGQWDAARALGFRFLPVLFLVVLPQAVRMVIPPLTNRTIAITKGTALASVVGVSEILGAAQSSMAFSANPTPLTLGALAYAILFLPVVGLGRWIERRFTLGRARGA